MEVHQAVMVVVGMVLIKVVVIAVEVVLMEVSDFARSGGDHVGGGCYYGGGGGGSVCPCDRWV